MQARVRVKTNTGVYLAAARAVGRLDGHVAGGRPLTPSRFNLSAPVHVSGAGSARGEERKRSESDDDDNLSGHFVAPYYGERVATNFAPPDAPLFAPQCAAQQ